MPDCRDWPGLAKQCTLDYTIQFYPQRCFRHVAAQALRMMQTRLGALQKTIFTPDRGEVDPRACDRAHPLGGIVHVKWNPLPLLCI